MKTSRSGVRGAFVFELLGAHAADVRERALDGSDHVRERDLARRAREPVAAFRAALAGDDAGVLEIEQDVLEEAQRHRLRARERLGLDVPFALRRELDGRTKRVVGLRRESH